MEEVIDEESGTYVRYVQYNGNEQDRATEIGAGGLILPIMLLAAKLLP